MIANKTITIVRNHVKLDKPSDQGFNPNPGPRPDNNNGGFNPNSGGNQGFNPSGNNNQGFAS